MSSVTSPSTLSFEAQSPTEPGAFPWARLAADGASEAFLSPPQSFRCRPVPCDQLLDRPWASRSGSHAVFHPEPSPTPHPPVLVYSQSHAAAATILEPSPQPPERLGTHEQSLPILLNVPAPGNY